MVNVTLNSVRWNDPFIDSVLRVSNPLSDFLTLAWTPPQNITADGSVQALILDLGAHHLDLMFMDDNDPECAIYAREVELAAIKGWAGLA